MTTATRPAYPNLAIEGMLADLERVHRIHRTDVRCPVCGVGRGRWCIGTESLAGPTDQHPSHQARLRA